MAEAYIQIMQECIGFQIVSQIQTREVTRHMPGVFNIRQVHGICNVMEMQTLIAMAPGITDSRVLLDNDWLDSQRAQSSRDAQTNVASSDDDACRFCVTPILRS